MQFVIDEQTKRAYYKEMDDRPLTREEIAESEKYEKMFQKYNRMPKLVRDMLTYPITAKRAVARFLSARKQVISALPEQTSPTAYENEYAKSNEVVDNIQSQVYPPEEINENYNEIGNDLRTQEKHYDNLEV